jgi:lipopolysaccharide heptosyltransferase I
MRSVHSRAVFGKILIVKPSSLGDVVHSLPFLHAVRSCFPKAELHWVIAKGLEGLLQGHPMIDRLVSINKDLWKKISSAETTLKEIIRLFRQLRNEQYDLVVDLQGLLRSGLITMVTSAPVRVGFAEAREGSRFFYTLKVRAGREVHAVERNMKIAAALGCRSDDIVFPFPPDDENSGKGQDLKKRFGEYSVIVPGARWKTKIWPSENFGRVAAMLPIRSVVIGSETERRIAEEVVSYSMGKALSLAGETGLKELLSVIRSARMVITNDSGPMYIAAALHVPVIAVFGPTSPLRTGPYGTGNIVLQSSAECVPCFKKTCRGLRCMHDITTDAVSREALRALRKAN